MPGEQVEKRTLNLPSSRKEDWRKSLPIQLNQLKPCPLEINCNDWRLCCRDITQLIRIVEKAGFQVSSVSSNIPETIVSASGMGLESYLNLQYSNKISSHSKDGVNQSSSSSGISFQKGTLRSGENLDVDGDVLLVGDVNPGAKIAATGNVLVWGRLRGTAHAGTNGNQLAKIIALELRPLQLRIADKIARGPEEKPEPGLAEEAQLESGKIVIQPAKPNALRT